MVCSLASTSTQPNHWSNEETLVENVEETMAEHVEVAMVEQNNGRAC